MLERIEFIGIPGSGKSTLCNMVLAELRKNDEVDLFNNVYKESISKHIKGQDIGLIRYIRFIYINKLFRGNYSSASLYGEIVTKYMLDNSSVYKSLLDSIVNTIEPERRQYILKYLLMDIYKWKIIRDNTNNDNLVLMDEGFVHRALNIFMHNDTNFELDLKLFLSTIDYPKVVVNVKCDIKEAINRMGKRKQGIPVGFKFYSETELIKELSLMEVASDKIMLMLKKEGIRVIQVENSNLEIAKKEVMEFLC